MNLIYLVNLYEKMDIESNFKYFLQCEPYKHQLKAAEFILKGEPVVIRAPCGSGKTEACYIPFLMGRGEMLPTRLIYSLPTRALVEDIAGRIREGVESKSPVNVSCHHGANAEDPFFKNDIIVTTIDQAFSAYCCTPLSLPPRYGNIPAGAAVASMLCFDEVHTYDYTLGLQTMLALVDRIMNSKLDLPFVVMSATLPDNFLEWFRERGIQMVEAEEEEIPKRRSRRVVLHWVGKFLEPKDILEKVDCGRIIIVCNTVERAQFIYSKIVDAEVVKSNRIPVFLLHSRFLEADRKKILEEVKPIFKNGTRGCLVTTQVCEVGLDISCDLLLTELATPDALIQRMGRCAREGGTGEVYVFDVASLAPYKEESEVVNNTRDYIKNNLDGKVIKWDVELQFLNSLLKDRFEKVIQDDDKRFNLLKALGDAAFLGDKKGIERCIREILNANVTIHDAPEKFSHDEVCRMPWLSIDIRVLESFIKKYKPKIWEIRFSDDDCRLEVGVTETDRVNPYGWYVFHPSFADYDEKLGLRLGCPGERLQVIGEKEKEIERGRNPQYLKEPWVEHSIKCLREFESLEHDEEYSIKLVSRILGGDYKKTIGLIAICVALHDIGKLNFEWQEIAGAGEEPLAHTDKSDGFPPHAPIAAHALKKIFDEYIPHSRELGLAFRLALAHHHHTRAENVPRYKFVQGWRQYVTEVLDRLEKYKMAAVDVNKIDSMQEKTTKLPIRFPDIENVRMYTVYSIVSRIVRICDWGALDGW
jgi:CRISPR-associated endonuclease/helicase Cas3